MRTDSDVALWRRIFILVIFIVIIIRRHGRLLRFPPFTIIIVRPLETFWSSGATTVDVRTPQKVKLGCPIPQKS